MTNEIIKHEQGPTCPRCQREGLKVIYLGFPMKFCDNPMEGGDECACLWGFWSFVPTLWFNGMFMTYEGSYWKALWHWLRGGEEDEG